MASSNQGKDRRDTPPRSIGRNFASMDPERVREVGGEHAANEGRDTQEPAGQAIPPRPPGRGTRAQVTRRGAHQGGEA